MTTITSPAQKLATGDVANNAIPLHPALVHFPLVLYPLSAILRALGFYRLVNIPGALDWAHYFNLAAILWTVPTALTGWAEYKKIPAGKPEAKETANRHMFVNVIVTLLAIYNWYSIRTSDGFFPTQTNVILGLVGIAALVYSGHLGGKLVYKHGLGVQRQGEGLSTSAKR